VVGREKEVSELLIKHDDCGHEFVICNSAFETVKNGDLICPQCDPKPFVELGLTVVQAGFTDDQGNERILPGVVCDECHEQIHEQQDDDALHQRIEQLTDQFVMVILQDRNALQGVIDTVTDEELELCIDDFCEALKDELLEHALDDYGHMFAGPNMEVFTIVGYQGNNFIDDNRTIILALKDEYDKRRKKEPGAQA
jgi:hypothetical protein